jgi:O-methyltransferase involved in polyketide biosynthesis
MAGPLKSEPEADHLKRLLLPVIVRAMEKGKPSAILKDKTSSEIYRRLDQDLTNYIESTNELRNALIIARTQCFESIIIDFLRRYPDATIVNLGCRLDVAYERINNPSIYWYDIDLDNVMGFIKSFLSETSNRKFLTSSLTKDNWFKEIINRGHILFIASGVFYYYEDEKIKRFLKRLSRTFPLSELTFDVFNHKKGKIANRFLSKLEGESSVKWHLKSINEILSWDKHLRLIDRKNILKLAARSLNCWDRFYLMISGSFCKWYVLHFRILPDYRHL